VSCVSRFEGRDASLEARPKNPSVWLTQAISWCSAASILAFSRSSGLSTSAFVADWWSLSSAIAVTCSVEKPAPYSFKMADALMRALRAKNFGLLELRIER